MCAYCDILPLIDDAPEEIIVAMEDYNSKHHDLDNKILVERHT